MRARRPRAEFGRLRGRAPRDFGTLAIEFLSGEDGRAPMTVMRVAMRPRDSHPPLLHERTDEFFVVLRGSLEARVDAVRRRMRTGDYAYLPAGTPHAFRAGPGGVEVLSVFTPGLDPDSPDIVRVGDR